jgi:tetratricopeptide (TPR) repeat protein
VEKLIMGNQFTKALTQLEAAKSAGEPDADFYFLRAKAYSGQGRFDKAKSDIEQALNLDGKFVEAMGHKAIILLNTGDIQGAMNSVNAALEMEKDGELLYTRGAIYAALMRFEEAIKDLNEALVLDGNNANYYIARGEVSMRMKRTDEAKRDFEKAIELAPGDPRPYLGRGGLYLILGERVKARQDFDRCLEIDPNFALANLRRGKYYELTGNLERALADYRKASNAMPQSDEAWFERTRAELAAAGMEGDKKSVEAAFEAAEKSARHLVEISNHPGRAHKVLATVLGSRGKREESIHHFTKAIDANPKDIEAIYLRGSAYAFMKNYDQAVKDFDQAVSIMPDYLDPYISKANVYLMQDQPEKALQVYSQVIAKDPENLTVLKLRYELYKAMGNLDAASEDLGRMKKLQQKLAQ